MCIRDRDSSSQVQVRTVQVGPVTGNNVVIESGLEAGERVIVEGLQKVRPGMTVRVMESESPAPSAADAE